MKKLFSAAAFAAGLSVVGWVGTGYLASHPLALATTLLIAGFYVLGALELLRFMHATDALREALQALQDTPQRLADWLAPLPDTLRSAVQQRIEGTRAALPGPVLAPYLSGLLVLLGMLGTFAGMAVALNGTGAALEGAQGLAAIRDALSAPVRGLGLAFGTSVAGVAASAALGLMTALARRERIQAAQQLDAAMSAALRPFSSQHQRETQLRLMEQQANLLPDVAERIQACMDALERQQQALGERLQAEQTRFYRDTEQAFQGLATSVQHTLSTSAADSAERAGAALQPAVQAALAGLAQESMRLQDAMAQQLRQQLDGLASQWGQSTAATAAHWREALAAHQRAQDAHSHGLGVALTRFTEDFTQHAHTLAQQLAQQTSAQAEAQNTRWEAVLAQRSQQAGQLATQQQQALQAATDGLAGHAAALQATVEQAHDALQARWAAQDETRLAAWTQALQTHAAALHAQWQTQGAQAHAQLQQVHEALAQTAQALRAQGDAQLQQQADTQARRSAQDEQRLAAWTEALQTQTAGLLAQWQAHGAQAQGEMRQLHETLARTAEHITAQNAAQAQHLLDSLAQRATQDEQRLAAWTQALQAQAETLRTQWQDGSAQTQAHLQQLQDTLARAAHDIHTQGSAQAQHLLDGLAQRAAQDEQRLATWAQTLQAQAAQQHEALRQTAAEATRQQQQVSAALADAAGEITRQLHAQAQGTLGEVAALLQAAGEAPRAAAEAMGELRAKLADSMARDDAMLQERGRILEALAAQLEAARAATAEQRSAIDTLVQGATDMLAQAHARFESTLQAQAAQMEDVGAHARASAVEVASLGEAFGGAVQLFGDANAQTLAQLQRVEAALAQALARSDEQLDYYVAQAREVIELSVGAQKQIIDALQQLAARGEAAA